MNKTRKEIADALGVSKSTVYRAIKDNGILSIEERAGATGSFTRLYDEKAQEIIRTCVVQRESVQKIYVEPVQNHKKTAESVQEPVQNPKREPQEPVQEPLHEPLIELLQSELARKNEEIDRLLKLLEQAHESLDQEQKLHAATKQLLLEKQESDAEPGTKKSIGSWFRKWRKGSAENETVNSESE